MRDPRIDPQEGDVLRRGDRTIIVHFLKDGVVYCGTNRPFTAGVRLPLEDFRRDAATADYVADRDTYVADEIRAGQCPFGSLDEGQPMAHCPSGFPGCACADELMSNPHLKQQHAEAPRIAEGDCSVPF